jgi:hypothetical protein
MIGMNNATMEPFPESDRDLIKNRPAVDIIKKVNTTNQTKPIHHHTHWVRKTKTFYVQQPYTSFSKTSITKKKEKVHSPYFYYYKNFIEHQLGLMSIEVLLSLVLYFRFI